MDEYAHEALRSDTHFSFFKRRSITNEIDEQICDTELTEIENTARHLNELIIRKVTSFNALKSLQFIRDLLEERRVDIMIVKNKSYQ